MFSEAPVCRLGAGPTLPHPRAHNRLRAMVTKRVRTPARPFMSRADVVPVESPLTPCIPVGILLALARGEC
jgi:hypothetical protein